MDIYPFSANDIAVVENNLVRKFQYEDWGDTHKLLVFIPEAFTPVCQTELGAMNDWREEFLKLNCEIIAGASEPAHKMIDWYNQEDSLKNATYKTFCSYLLPARLGLVRNGRVIRSSVFVSDKGEVVKQEMPERVGRSFRELHRMVWAYNQDSYCGEGWQDPSDNIKTEA